MPSNKTNTVLFLKDIESNIIEEAIIVVKGNIKIGENKVISSSSVLKDAEMIINKRIEENENSFLKFKIDKLLKRNKTLRIINISLIILLIILILA